MHPDDAKEFLEFIAGHVEALPLRNTVLVLGDLNAVMRRSLSAPFVSSRENANIECLLDFTTRLDFVSVNTCFHKPPIRLATFIGFKRRRRNCSGKNATRRLAQLDHILIRRRERQRVTNCDTIQPLLISSDRKVLFCDISLLSLSSAL